MKKLFLLSICLLLLETLFAQTGKIRVATVGNSLTGATNDYGFYGMALSEMLGDEYEVTKFGKGASGIFIKLREDGTTEENPNEYKFAYINSEECAAALAYNPDIVVIKFGANDANKKLFETYGKETFKDDYKKLINKFRALPTHPDVYICLTPPMFYGEGGFLGSFDDAASREYIHTSVKEIAEELNLTYVDLYTPLKDHPEYMPGGMDWVHPDHRGHYIIAREVFKAIKGSFIMNPGGVRTETTQIDLSGSKAKLKNQAIINGKNGQKISFDVHFGDIPTYEKVEVETQLNKAKSGTFDFYLDNEPAAFASIDISRANKKNYSVQSALFNRQIKGNHTVTVQWNGHNANLRSITIKEQHMPFVNEDDTKQYYIVNKATGLVLDCDTATKTIRASARIPGNATQLFTVEHFTYHTFRIRNIETDLHIQNRQETVVVGKPGDNWRIDDPKYSLFIKPTGDGSFTIRLSGSEAIGILSAENTIVIGNKNVNGQSISGLDKWEFIEADNTESINLIIPDLIDMSPENIRIQNDSIAALGWEKQLLEGMRNQHTNIQKNGLTLEKYELTGKMDLQAVKQKIVDSNNLFPIYIAPNKFKLHTLQEISTDSDYTIQERISDLENKIDCVYQTGVELVTLYWDYNNTKFSTVCLVSDEKGGILYDNILSNIFISVQVGAEN